MSERQCPDCTYWHQGGHDCIAPGEQRLLFQQERARLRAQEAVHRESEGIEAELARLREALRQITELRQTTREHYTSAHLLVEAHAIARKALEPHGDD